MAHKKGQNISFSINSADIIVQGDPRRLKQILVNLLSNAVKYSPEKGPIGLDVNVNKETNSVNIEVWDKGMGIAPENIERLFQPFVQLDSTLSRQQSGTGLGLALVKRLVEMHGGTIRVESALEQGSRFIVVLPFKPARANHKEDPQKRSIHIQHSLVVEDSPNDSSRLTRFLKLLGIHSTVQAEGKGVVQRAASLQPGVILLDLNLPDISGWEVLEELKKNEKTRRIPVIVTSVREERSKAAQLGVDGYLVKLFTLDDLRIALQSIRKPELDHEDQALIVSAEIQNGVIMIVDDNETNIMMIEDYLRSKNYNVFSSLSGTEFLASVGTVQPDLILMDIQMPGMDGFEAIQKLRLLPQPELASIPVIATTALAMPGDRERCLEAGADEYISKPIRLKELTSMIQRILLENEEEQ
jgi:CheY-like chemotaxis protein/anti-sigma regulatory factor (Ser/Thr protein kinase)